MDTDTASDLPPVHGPAPLPPPTTAPMHPPTPPPIRATPPTVPTPPAPPPPSAPAPPAHRPPEPGDTARSAAVWLGGTGALLLLAAAAVAVAVRWDDLGAWTKLIGLLAVHGGVLWTGERLDRTLPATARALRTLGGLLIPVSTVAVALTVDATWQATLAASSAATVAGLLAMDNHRRSPLLSTVGLGAVVPLAGGFAALTHTPGALVLAGAAAIGLLLIEAGDRREALVAAVIAWAGSAAALPLLTAIDDPVFASGDIVSALGLTRSTIVWAHAAAGLVAAGVLARLAHRRDDVALALGAIGSALVGCTATFVQATSTNAAHLVAITTLALGFQLAMVAVRARSPWNRTIPTVGVLTEIVMTLVTIDVAIGAAFALSGGFLGISGAEMAADVGVVAPVALGLAWLVADERRRATRPTAAAVWLAGSGWVPATIALPVLVWVGVATATLDLPSAALGLAITGAALVTCRRGGSDIVAAGIAVVATLMTVDDSVIVPIALVGASTMICIAARDARRDPVTGGSGALFALEAVCLVAAGAASTGAQALLGSASEPIAWAGFVVGSYLVAWLGDRADVEIDRAGAGLIGRFAAVIPAGAALLAPTETPMLAAIGALVICALVDHLRSGDPRLLAPAVVSTGGLVALGLTAGGLALPMVGLALVVTAAVAIGIGVVTHGAEGPLGLVAVTTALAGALHASTDIGAFSTSLIVLGGAIIVAGAVRDRLEVVVSGAAIATAGLWMRLTVQEVQWSEAYVAPIALTVIAIGISRAGRTVASWWTHGTAVTLMGVAAMSERLGGGSGTHALIAGIVGVVAVTAGAQWRRIGPLVCGTVLLAIVAGHESLAHAASVPTWAWLAAGGTVLLGTGVAVERTATSPVETSRRMLATIGRAYR